MKSKKIILLSLFALIVIFLSACSSSVYASTSWHGVSATTDKTYLAAGAQVYAIDLKTGSENWHYPDKANARVTFYATPVLTPDGQLLVPGYDKFLHSLNPATGTENWVFEDSGNRLIGSPLVLNNMIYQPSSDHYLYALDMSGKEVWKYETSGPIWATPATMDGCNCIYVASMDHSVYSLDASTGRMLWQTQDLGGAMVGTPAVSPDGVIYVGTFGNELLALDSSNGNIKWRFGTQDWVWSGPVLSNGVLYVGDLSGFFYAVNSTDGTSQWRLQPQNAIVSPPVIVGDTIYLTTEGDTLFTISTAGNVITSKVIGGLIYASPVVSGDTLLVSPTNFDSLLVAMNMDGSQKWTYAPAKK